MRGTPLIGLSMTATAALVAGLLTNPISTSTPALASDSSVFTGPAYPSDECTSVVNGANIGIVPQQWNSSVGLPLTPSGTPAAQRIVIPEFDQVPSMGAVNGLLRQCGLLASTDSDYVLDQDTLPTADGWTAPATAAGLEATLDATIAYAALPPNATVTIANTDAADGWYGFFVNAAQACGIDFATAPAPSDTAANVPAMSKGSNYPAGGCIISASWGGNEQTQFAAPSLTNTQAANVVIERLADLGVLMFISAGDEGAGGCWTGANLQEITGVALSTPGSPETLAGLTFYKGTGTITTAAAHGYTAGTDIIINRLVGPPNVTVLQGIFEVVDVPASPADGDGNPLTFTIEQALTASIQITQSSAFGVVASLSGPNYGVTFNQALEAAGAKFLLQTGAKIPSFPATHPDVVAVGGTQWRPQADTVATDPFTIPYTAGRPYSEFVWKDSNMNPNCSNAPAATTLGQEGTGGGVSEQFAMPDYQRAQAEATYGSLGANAKRMMPDIAALAGWPTYAIGSPSANTFCAGGVFPCAANTFPWTPVVGTSAAAPLSAIGFANLNAVLSARGFAPVTKGGSNDVHSLIYSTANASAFNDVPEFRGATASGNNNLFGEIFGVTMGYSALNGFDMTTGMGVPNFSTLANLLIARNTPAPAPAPTSQPTSQPTTQPAAQPTPQPTPTQTPDPVANVIANPTAVTASTINALTPAQVAAIPPTTFGQLPPRAFRGLTPDQARELSTAQVAAIRPARARKIRPAVLRSFTPEQIETLRPKSIRALRPNQIRLLRPKQLRALTPRQERQLRPKQLDVMTPAQRRALR